jgi:transcriptional regulator with XRE-family HTH domain
MKLGLALSGYRDSRSLTVRALAKQIGVSHATLSRVERGYACDSGTLAKIMVWLLAK